MNVNFKAGVTEDIPQILKFMYDFYELSRYPFDEKKNEESLRNLIDNNNLGKIWIIEYDSKAAGYMILTFGYSIEYKGRDAFIDELFIEEGLRGKGIGKAAMNFLFNEAKKLEINAVHLEVERDNHTAKNLYIKYNFQDNGRTLMTKWIEK